MLLGGGNLDQQLASMGELSRTPSVRCAATGGNCISAFALDSRTAVVWNLSARQGSGDLEAFAFGQGAAIRDLIKAAEK
jgi:hypothetical protein